MNADASNIRPGTCRGDAKRVALEVGADMTPGPDSYTETVAALAASMFPAKNLIDGLNCQSAALLELAGIQRRLMALIESSGSSGHFQTRNC